MPAIKRFAGMARSYNLFTTNRLIHKRRYGDSPSVGLRTGLPSGCQTPSINPCAGW